MNIYNDVNLNAKYITNVGKLAHASGLSSEFIKANGDLDNNVYITASDAVITTLQNKTQNLSGAIMKQFYQNFLTVILKNSGC